MINAGIRRSQKKDNFKVITAAFMIKINVRITNE